MSEVSVATGLTNLDPSRPFKFTDDFTHFHDLTTVGRVSVPDYVPVEIGQ